MHRHCCYLGWAILAFTAGCNRQQQPGPPVAPTAAEANQIVAEVIAAQPVKFDPAAPQWGDLSAVFLYDGEPPPRKPLPVDKDQSARRDPLYPRDLVVDPETKGIQYVCAWLLVNEKYPPAIHPEYAALLEQPIVVTMDKLDFEPYVSMLRIGQKLIFKNNDHVGHNASTLVATNGLFPAGAEAQELFTQKNPTAVPQPISCSIHPWMSALIHLQDHPYMAVSNAEGELQIKNLPVGKHAVVFWHQRAGFLKEIKRGDKVEKLPKGRLTIEIKPTNNYLGEITI